MEIVVITPCPKNIQVKNPKLLAEIRKRGKCIISDPECYGPLGVEHTKTRGSGGADSFENCVLMCLWHHNKKGSGVFHMIRDYPVYVEFLVLNDFHKLIEGARRVAPLKDKQKIESNLIEAGYAP